MTRRVLLVFSSVAMLAASLGVTAASADPQTRSVSATAKPALTGGILDASDNLKVYGGQTAANVGSGSPLSIGTQTARNRSSDILAQPFATYGYKWYRYDGDTYTAIAGATGAKYNARSADVGYTLLVRERPCYTDPDNEELNICSIGSVTPDFSWSVASPMVTFFASTAPTVSTIVGNKISVTGYGVWQGFVVGSTKSIQWQSCVYETGCSDIGGAASKKLTLTSAQDNSYIRAKITLATLQGADVTADAYSDSVGYNIILG